MLIVYEYVPVAFGRSLTFPISKSYTHKYEDSVNNNRGISVSPIISKVLEHWLLNKFINFFWIPIWIQIQK